MDLPKEFKAILPELKGLFHRVILRNELTYPLEVIVISASTNALAGFRIDENGIERTCLSKETQLVSPLEINLFDSEGRRGRIVITAHCCPGIKSGILATEHTA